MRYCSKCGGPIKGPLRELTVHGCRLCWLDLWTSQEVRWDAEEDAGYSAEGEALSAVEAWMARDALADGSLTVERANAPCPRVTSTWLPPNEREPLPRFWLDDAKELHRWHADSRPEEPQPRWMTAEHLFTIAT